MYVASVDRTLIADGTYFVRERPTASWSPAAAGAAARAPTRGSGGVEDEGAGDARLLDPAAEPATCARHVRACPTGARRGLGRRILEACEAAARAEGFRRLVLGATLPGRPFYEAYGFRATGDERVLMPNGVELAAVLMEMPLG